MSADIQEKGLSSDNQIRVHEGPQTLEGFHQTTERGHVSADTGEVTVLRQSKMNVRRHSGQVTVLRQSNTRLSADNGLK